MQTPLTLILPFLSLLPPALSNTHSTQYSTGTSAGLAANLDITSWTGSGCTGTAIQNPNLLYSYNVEAETWSYNLSRALGPDEQLDWSGLPDGVVKRDGDASLDQWCGKYDHTAPAGQGTGCVSFKKTLPCFRLWHY